MGGGISSNYLSDNEKHRFILVLREKMKDSSSDSSLFSDIKLFDDLKSTFEKHIEQSKYKQLNTDDFSDDKLVQMSSKSDNILSFRLENAPLDSQDSLNPDDSDINNTSTLLPNTSNKSFNGENNQMQLEEATSVQNTSREGDAEMNEVVIESTTRRSVQYRRHSHAFLSAKFEHDPHILLQYHPHSDSHIDDNHHTTFIEKHTSEHRLPPPSYTVENRLSNDNDHTVTDSIDITTQKINQYIEQLKNGDMKGGTTTTRRSSEFRIRRLTYEQTINNATTDPLTPIDGKMTKLTLYASTEMGMTSTLLPPFPLDIVGTFSCHGIEPNPEYSSSGQYNIKSIEKTNQDRGCVVYPYINGLCSLFMVLDGHGEQGDQVSEYVMRQVVLLLEKHKSILTNPKLAFHETLLNVHYRLTKTPILHMTSGCTFVGTLLIDNIMYIANVGDSRAIMGRLQQSHNNRDNNLMNNSTKSIEKSDIIGLQINDDINCTSNGNNKLRTTSNDSEIRNGETSQDTYSTIKNEDNNYENNEYIAIQVTTDHKPNIDSERERIIDAGGYVKIFNYKAPSRVYLDPEMTIIGLATSRTIGDTAVKDIGVTAIPDIFEIPLSAEDKFMILATDGVWEFISNQEAVNIVGMFLDEGATVACQELIAAAMMKWEEYEGDYRDDTDNNGYPYANVHHGLNCGTPDTFKITSKNIETSRKLFEFNINYLVCY